MGDFFALLFLVFLILYVVYRKKDKKIYGRVQKKTNYFLVACISFGLICGMIGSNDSSKSTKNTQAINKISTSSNNISTSSKKYVKHKKRIGSSVSEKISKRDNKIAKSNATKSSSSKVEYDFSKLKLGMSKEEVIGIMGTPTDQNSITLYYGTDDLDFDNKGKLSNGSPVNISQAADESSNSISVQSEKNQQSRTMLIGYAKRFGGKDVESLQKLVGTVYTSQYIQNKGTIYLWVTDVGTLVRCDDDDTNETTVYKYNDSTDNNLGEVLYQGKTILQKNHTTIFYP